jgi:integrase
VQSGNPNTKLLFALKTLARRAKMNCGRCEGCKSKRRECESFTLHKFRRSYITTLLRNGIDLRTVQAYAGHKDIASTMRYLRSASAKEAQGKLNAVVW